MTSDRVLSTDTSRNPPGSVAVTHYSVCVPSKMRPGNMKAMMGFFPYARVYVDRKEEADYAPRVPPGQLFLHDSLPDQWHIWRFILENEEAECVMLCDDDLEWVHSLADTETVRRRYTRAVDLQRIVENAVNVLCDLDLGLYGWTMMAHPGGFNPTNPIGLTGVLTSAIVVRGRGLEIDVDTLCCDLDLTLQSLLKNRVLIKHMGLYWNFGVAGVAPGGCQTTDSMETILESRRRMVEKWGRYICMGNLPLTARMNGTKDEEGGNVQNMGHTVSRKSTIVIKG